MLQPALNFCVAQDAQTPSKKGGSVYRLNDNSSTGGSEVNARSESLPAGASLMAEGNLLFWFKRAGLQQNAQGIIKNIRTSPPSRLVGSGYRQSNASGTFPSQKMGLKLQFESRTLEWPYLYLIEHDEDILEMYDQPPSIKIAYEVKGTTITHLYTPDFFVLRKDGAGWVELKKATELHELAQKWPSRYVFTAGKWTCPPGEAHAAQFGLTFTVVTDKDLPKVLIQNYGYLNSYYSIKGKLDVEKLAIIQSSVTKAPGVSLERLLSDNPTLNADDIHLAIVQNQIYCDLHHVFLGQHDNALLFADKITGDAYLRTLASKATEDSVLKPRALVLAPGGTIIVFGKKFQILELSANDVQCVSPEGTIVRFQITELIQLGPDHVGGVIDSAAGTITDLLSKVSPQDLNLANQKYDLLKSGGGSVHRVTLSRYARKYREAEAKYGYGFLGLIANDSNKGNRSPRYPQSTIAMGQKVIKDHYLTKTGKSIKLVYGIFREVCADQQIFDIPSIGWFTNQIKAHQQSDRINARAGHRAAYQNEAPLDGSGEVIPKNGDFPWHVAHIDHTLGDIELKSGESGRNLGRPWITVLICAYSRKILALVVSYDPPSYRTCLLLIQECLKRHSRLPEVVVIDNGAEFDSVYFTAILNMFVVVKLDRPPSKPRFGAIIESMFCRINDDFIHNLEGNTKQTKDVRQVTKSTDPKNNAKFTLATFRQRFDGFLDLYHKQDHSSLGTSPSEQYDLGLVRFGHRPHRRFPYGEDIRILTLATTKTGMATVRKGRIRINYIDYTCDKLRDSRFWQTKVPVRYDPWDATSAYVFLDGLWRPCRCGYLTQFRGRSEKQIAVASEEIRRSKSLQGKNRSITAAQLAAFFLASDSEELALQAEQDRELCGLIRGNVLQEPTPIDRTQIVDPKGPQPSPRARIIPEPDDDDDAEPYTFKTFTV